MRLLNSRQPEKFESLYPSLEAILAVDKNSLVCDTFTRHLFNCWQALEQKKFDDACRFATNAALQYGVPGIVMYYKASLEALRELANVEDCIQASALNLFALLRAARMMCAGYDNSTILEPDAQTTIVQYFPEYRAKDHPKRVDWESMEMTLIKLGDIQGWVEGSAAQSIYDACCKDRREPTSNKTSPDLTPREGITV